MAYFLVQDFAAGLDLRKSALTAKPGGLRVLSNASINSGGEVDKAKRLSPVLELPSTTMGLAGINRLLYVFGLDAPASVLVVQPFVYQQLVPSPALDPGVALDRILDADVYGSKVYVIARFTDGVVRHFYDGAQVTTAPDGYYPALVHKSKLHAVKGNVLAFTAVGSTSWTAGTGFGSIDVSNEETGAADLVGLATYYDRLALLGRRTIQVWSMDPDPAKNQMVQNLANIGLVSPQATVRYGSGDVLFLADTGIRSLRAKDSSNQAATNDIGSPIDPYVRELFEAAVPAELEKIQGLVDPLTGQVWFVWKNLALVLSYHPATNVSAWSVFELPAAVDYATVSASRVFIRCGNQIYIYGAPIPTDQPVPDLPTTYGGAVSDYDNSLTEVVTPMMDFDKPATSKTFLGIDLACEGTWAIEYNVNPRELDQWTPAATVNNSTYSQARIPISGVSTHIALRLRSSSGYCRLGAVGVHFQLGNDE